MGVAGKTQAVNVADSCSIKVGRDRQVCLRFLLVPVRGRRACREKGEGAGRDNEVKKSIMLTQPHMGNLFIYLFIYLFLLYFNVYTVL